MAVSVEIVSVESEVVSVIDSFSFWAQPMIENAYATALCFLWSLASTAPVYTWCLRW